VKELVDDSFTHSIFNPLNCPDYACSGTLHPHASILMFHGNIMLHRRHTGVNVDRACSSYKSMFTLQLNDSLKGYRLYNAQYDKAY
jgi:hypothetical protein